MTVGIFPWARTKFPTPLEKIGSSVWRGKWYWENWEEAEEYVEGQKYDVVIFQKYYNEELYKNLDCIKILDICDPEWITSDWPIVEMSQYLDAIVCSSEGLRDALQAIVDIPVYFVDDRVSLGYAKEHKAPVRMQCRTVGWFGYSGHMQTLFPIILPVLKKLGLKLVIISDREISQMGYEDIITNVDYNWDTLPFDLGQCDIILNPPIQSPLAQYKSQNKTYLANAFGLPVARTADELRVLMDYTARKEAAEKAYSDVREKHHVGISIEEYKAIINELWKKRNK